MTLLSEAGVTVLEAKEREEAPAPATPAEPAKTAVVAAEATGEDEELGRTDDPVRMYLREMGSVELLSREGEIEIAKRIEAGQDKMIGGICESPMTITALLAWRDAINEGRILLRDVIDLEATQGGAPGEGKGVIAAPVPGAPPMPRPALPKLVRPAPAPAPAGNGEAGESATPQSGRGGDEKAPALSAAQGKRKTHGVHPVYAIA